MWPLVFQVGGWAWGKERHPYKNTVTKPWRRSIPIQSCSAIREIYCVVGSQEVVKCDLCDNYSRGLCKDPCHDFLEERKVKICKLRKESLVSGSSFESRTSPIRYSN
jgi:hypothetical protein